MAGSGVLVLSNQPVHARPPVVESVVAPEGPFPLQGGLGSGILTSH